MSDWRDQAACRDHGDAFVNVPVDLAGDGLYRATASLLRVCETCPFTGPGGLCDRTVDPKASQFDGVAAGAVWRNGRAVKVRVPVPPRPSRRKPVRCGTRTGYETHRRRGEKPCASCRAAKAEYGRRYNRNRKDRQGDVLAAALSTILTRVADDVERAAEYLPPKRARVDGAALRVLDAQIRVCGCGNRVLGDRPCTA